MQESGASSELQRPHREADAPVTPLRTLTPRPEAAHTQHSRIMLVKRVCFALLLASLPPAFFKFYQPFGHLWSVPGWAHSPSNLCSKTTLAHCRSSLSPLILSSKCSKSTFRRRGSSPTHASALKVAWLPAEFKAEFSSLTLAPRTGAAFLTRRSCTF